MSLNEPGQCPNCGHDLVPTGVVAFVPKVGDPDGANVPKQVVVYLCLYCTIVDDGNIYGVSHGYTMKGSLGNDHTESPRPDDY